MPDVLGVCSRLVAGGDYPAPRCRQAAAELWPLRVCSMNRAFAARGINTEEFRMMTLRYGACIIHLNNIDSFNEEMPLLITDVDDLEAPHHVVGDFL